MVNDLFMDMAGDGAGTAPVLNAGRENLMNTRWLVGTATLLTLPIGVAIADDIDKHFQDSFDVAPGHRLILESGDGDVSITAWDQDVLDVEVRYRVVQKSIAIGGKSEFSVDFAQSGSVVRIKEKRAGSSGLGIHYSDTREYTYTIRAPRYLELEIRGDDGDIELRDWKGVIDVAIDDGTITIGNVETDRVSLDVGDGDIDADNIRGELTVGADDGTIRVTDSRLGQARFELGDGKLTVLRTVVDGSGGLVVEFDDGDIVLDEVTSSDIRVRGEDGSLDLNLGRAESVDWDLRMDDGDTSLSFESGVSAVFSIETDDGQIRIDLAEAGGVDEERHVASGRLGGGEGRIRIRSNDGDVRFREL